MTEPVRFGLVGAGAIAHSHAQAFAGCEEAHLVAVADTRPGAAQDFAQRYGCTPYDSHRSMAEQARLDAVIVCTPPNTHPEISIDFLNRRVNVLCEKPFAIDRIGARAMLRAARTAGVQIAMASKFRYVRDVIEARRLVQSGLLGEVILFENAFTSRVDMTTRWNADPQQSGGGVLIDNGTHSVDLLRYFLGPLAAVHALEGKRVQDLAVEDTVHAFVRSAQNVMGSIDLSWSINKQLESYLQIHGSLGTLLVGWRESKYRLFAGGDWVVFGKGYDKVQAFRSQLTNFARAVRGEDQLVIQGEDALASVLVVEAAYRSLRRSGWDTVGGRNRRRKSRRPQLAAEGPG